MNFSTIEQAHTLAESFLAGDIETVRAALAALPRPEAMYVVAEIMDYLVMRALRTAPPVDVRKPNVVATVLNTSAMREVAHFRNMLFTQEL